MGARVLQWDQNLGIAYQISQVQTCFDISKQKDGYILLLVFCSSISSNFDCSELSVKKKKEEKKKVIRK